LIIYVVSLLETYLIFKNDYTLPTKLRNNIYLFKALKQYITI